MQVEVATSARRFLISFICICNMRIHRLLVAGLGLLAPLISADGSSETFRYEVRNARPR